MSDVRDVIMCAKFQIKIFMGYNFTGGRIFDFPIDFSMGLTTVQCYCAACDYLLTRDYLSCIPTPTHLLHDDDIVNLPDEDVRSHINSYYESIVQALHYSSCATVPRKKHGFYKFWWDEELTLLKKKAMQSFNVWAALSKPRTGIAFDDMRRDKAAYKLGIRSKERNGKNGVFR